MANPTSFMDLLQDAEVDLGAPPLEPFGEEVGEDEEDVGDDEEEVAEIGEEAFTAASRPHARSTNYTEAEDILLVRAWASVGMDATTGTDQTGKRYWHRIEDNYCRIKPKNCGFLSRSYRSLQGRWDLMKPACARWSAAMDQVRDAPPSGTVESDYETIAGMRYKEMAASKGKPFPFKHAWAILQTFDKWKLRDQETAPKKSKTVAGLTAGVILTSPTIDNVRYVLQIMYANSNNTTEYEALLHGLRMAVSMGIHRLEIAAYRNVVLKILAQLEGLEFHHVSRDNNQPQTFSPA
ncbi:uncharacterized protein LOC123405181 [Hordeum vulgare subsp. vulgare]|uniref:uncharacterized protein LOC123405181 n=1 Tax=Hordeum vulgare subsp. vulgare TaxID=112509 RepID=UPI001D1A5794|nr:uncharacterized protein LOC123405181 [Hordeum vulgare subsp. vulgare]